MKQLANYYLCYLNILPVCDFDCYGKLGSNVVADGWSFPDMSYHRPAVYCGPVGIPSTLAGR